MNYPFNTGDQLCCGQCAVSYLEAAAKVTKMCVHGIRFKDNQDA